MHQYFGLIAAKNGGFSSSRRDGDPLPASTTPAVRVLSNPGSPLTASPGLPISRWWSGVSPVLSRHCATGIGASSPVHAAVGASRSDWTALSETSSVEHPCRHDNLPISQQGCVCWRVGKRRTVEFLSPNFLKKTPVRFSFLFFNVFATSWRFYCQSRRLELICPLRDLGENMVRSSRV